MAFVEGVAVTVVDGVEMVAAGHGLVAAAGLVLVVPVLGVHGVGAFALVPVVGVLVVDVAVVEVVHVVFMSDRGVSALGVVDVGVILMGRAGGLSNSSFAGVGESIQDDVADVFVGKAVDDLAALPLPCSNSRRLEHRKVL
jgi:hypothetical protein